MATVSNDADEIRRQMAAIRRAMHEDVKEVVATAEAATDWKRYLVTYPWASIGVAFGVGYLIVPKRHHRTADALKATQADLTKVREMVESTGKRVVETAKAQTDPPGRRKGLIAAGLGMLAPLVWKTAQGYALKYLEQWIMQQQAAALHAGPAPAHPGYPGGQAPQGGGPGTPGGMGPGWPPTGPRRAGGPGAV